MCIHSVRNAGSTSDIDESKLTGQIFLPRYANNQPEIVLFSKPSAEIITSSESISDPDVVR